MNLKEMLKFADDIVFAKTGQHLDDLQAAVLRGTLQRETYKEIAQDFDCSESRTREIGSELWQILSEELGEDINKKNFRYIQMLHKKNRCKLTVLTSVENLDTRQISQIHTHQIKKHLTQNQLKLYIKI
jgi:hypothetical protein